MAELLGQHRYQLDAKGRIALPAKYREAFADGAYLTLGQDGCLLVFPQQEFDGRSERSAAARSRSVRPRLRADVLRLAERVTRTPRAGS